MFTPWYAFGEMGSHMTASRSILVNFSYKPSRLHHILELYMLVVLHLILYLEYK